MAAAAVIVGAVVAIAALRGRATPVVNPQTPLTAAAVAADPPGEGAAGSPPPEGTGNAADPATSPEEGEAPMVMDLPDTPGHTGGAGRARNAKPGKPQRPKFLNTRE